MQQYRDYWQYNNNAQLNINSDDIIQCNCPAIVDSVILWTNHLMVGMRVDIYSMSQVYS